jgi:alpha-tubulin suppressor-like RCC1 family protein
VGTHRRLLVIVGLVASLGAPGFGVQAASWSSATEKPGHTPPRRAFDVWESVSAGARRGETGSHTCGIHTNATLWCWGRGGRGQIGTGDRRNRLSPERVDAAHWVQVAAGSEHTCGIRDDHSLWCWGANGSGQLGLGDTDDRSVPTQVGSGSDWTRVALGVDVTCALRDDDSLWCWGFNDHGQLGLGDTTDRSVPTEVGGASAKWAALGVGSDHACATRVDDSLWCWGLNDYGRLGVGDDEDRLVPTQVGGQTNWQSVSPGGAHTCGVRTDDTLWCWGADFDGQLGDGTFVSERKTPTQVGSQSVWRQVNTGSLHTCATRINGTLWCWGFNGSGELGIGSGGWQTISRPIQVGHLRTWTDVSAGGFYTCSPQVDKTLWCWGYPRDGQLGLGRRTFPHDVPIQVGPPNGHGQGNERLVAVSADTADDVWAVGDTTVGSARYTLVKHWDGTRWRTVFSPSPSAIGVNTLTSVTALSPTDVWAVGWYDTDSESWWGMKTLILHWNGTRWKQTPSPNPGRALDNELLSVDAASPTDIWAVGDYRWADEQEPIMLAEHWNGEDWEVVHTSRVGDGDGLFGVSGISATDAWAVGTYHESQGDEGERLFEHWNGTSWEPTKDKSAGLLAAVSSTAGDDVWAVGRRNIVHWDGTAWSKVAAPPLRGDLRAVSADSATNAWAVTAAPRRSAILQWNGAAWKRVTNPSRGQLLGVDSLLPTDAWAVGYQDTHALVLHWDGTTWTRES